MNDYRDEDGDFPVEAITTFFDMLILGAGFCMGVFVGWLAWA